VSLLLVQPLMADIPIRLSSVFTDGMVLQRDQESAVFGFAEPGAQVMVRFADQKKTATAGPEGKWKLRLDPLASSRSPRKLSIYDKKGTEIQTIQDILVGDVWLCAGQSNMALMMNYYLKNSPDSPIVDVPNTRYLKLSKGDHEGPQDEVQTKKSWLALKNREIGECSAVAYYFADHWAKNSKVPLGLIIAAEGGKIVETFMSSESLAALPSDIEVKATAKHNKPSLMYNPMIHPLHGTTIKGVIWYQAESNTFRNPLDYGVFFKAMITDWRDQWGRGNFPFLFVQLPSHAKPNDMTGEIKAWVRDAQAQALELPNTYMAVTLDVGEYEGVHPYHKQPVGDRLARIAEHLDGDQVLWNSPSYNRSEIEKDHLRIYFNGLAGKKLSTQRVVMNKTKDMPVGEDPDAFVMGADKLHGFEICGNDRQFISAEAKIVSANEVRVWSPSISDPIAVRYGWENFSLANLVGADGLPAAPFRTDRFDPPDYERLLIEMKEAERQERLKKRKK